MFTQSIKCPLEAAKIIGEFHELPGKGYSFDDVYNCWVKTSPYTTIDYTQSLVSIKSVLEQLEIQDLRFEDAFIGADYYTIKMDCSLNDIILEWEYFNYSSKIPLSHGLVMATAEVILQVNKQRGN